MIPEHAVAIRIIQVPDGDGPIAMRQQWVGLVLFPAVPVEGELLRGLESGLAGPNRRSYNVPAEVCVSILHQKSPEAADYFDQFLLQGCPTFSFGDDEVEVIG